MFGSFLIYFLFPDSKGFLPCSLGKIRGNGPENLKGMMPFPCILVIQLPMQNGRKP
jgi:hypothetical protein